MTDNMTELLFLTDAYLQTFEATVTAHAEGGVVLDRTAGGEERQGHVTLGDHEREPERILRTDGRNSPCRRG